MDRTATVPSVPAWLQSSRSNTTESGSTTGKTTVIVRQSVRVVQQRAALPRSAMPIKPAPKPAPLPRTPSWPLNLLRQDVNLKDCYDDHPWTVYQARTLHVRDALERLCTPTFIFLITCQPKKATSTGSDPTSLVSRYDRKGILPSSRDRIASPWTSTGKLPARDDLDWIAYRGNATIVIANANEMATEIALGSVVGLQMEERVEKERRLGVIRAIHFPIARFEEADGEPGPIPSIKVISDAHPTVDGAHDVLIAFGTTSLARAVRDPASFAFVIVCQSPAQTGGPNIPHLAPHPCMIPLAWAKHPGLRLVRFPCHFQLDPSGPLWIITDADVLRAMRVPDAMTLMQRMALLLSCCHLAPHAPFFIPCATPTHSDLLSIPLSWSEAIVVILDSTAETTHVASVRSADKTRTATLVVSPV